MPAPAYPFAAVFAIETHAMTLQLRGAITALVTPFRNGHVDLDRLKEQVAFQLDSGINGLVPCGTTGESPTLSFEEHKQVIETVVNAVANRVPVIAGAGSNNTAEAMERHQFAKAVGADAALSVNPYYNKPGQEGLYQHFMTLGEKVDLPIVLYNIPGRTGVTMSPQTIARLFTSGHIAAVKEATGDVTFASATMAECAIPMLSGDDPLTLPLMSIGAQGVISVLSNVMPAEVAALCKAALEGDFATAREIHRKVFNLTRSLFLDGNPVGVKYAMQTLGRDSGGLRLPLVQANEPTRVEINQRLKQAGLN